MSAAKVAGAVAATAVVGGGALFAAWQLGWLKSLGISSPAESQAAARALAAERAAQVRARASTVTPKHGNQIVLDELRQ